MTLNRSSKSDGFRRAVERFLDRLATRSGIGLVLATLVALIWYASVSLNSTVQKVLEDGDTYNELLARLPLATLSDVQRVILVLDRARIEGQMTEDRATEFVSALDKLYVRGDTFRNALPDHIEPSYANAAVADVKRIVELGDQAAAEGYADLDSLYEDIATSAEAIRYHLTRFNDMVRRNEWRILDEQVAAIRYQQLETRIALAVAGLIGIGALLLLRAEINSRQTRQVAEERVAFLAYFDGLTQLPNRASFHDRLTKSLESRTPFSLVLLDLDNFKGINDTFGHAGGDAALVFASETIGRHAEANGGFAARLGGDEFALILPFVDGDAVLTVCNMILADVAKGVSIDGDVSPVGLSIGVATSTGVAEGTGDPHDAMVRTADFALYVSKEAGRGQATLYDRTLEERYRERRAMQNALPDAIASRAIDVFFQPKVHLGTRRVYGFEALARWYWRGRYVSPDEFVALAEESGRIFDLDLLVLKESMRLMAEWNLAHSTDLKVSVNLSALHFTTKRIVKEVERALHASGLRPHLLTIEITETIEIRDWSRVQEVLSDLREMGCRISVDDFGTGFSSMAYLRTIQAHELKIDRTLVHEIETSDEARFIFDAVLDLARNLKMSVVVEGIETETQANTIASLGGVYAQGYLFGRPKPAQEALSDTLVVPPARIA